MIEEKKCVLVIDETLPAGLLVNTAAILGISLGHLAPEYIGPDITDGSGLPHKGIVKQPVPILKGDRDCLRRLRTALYGQGFEDMTVVDFSDIAQACKQYEDYTTQAGSAQESSFSYLGLLLYGSKKKVNKLTGSLPLLR